MCHHFSRPGMDINFGGDLFDVVRASGVEPVNHWMPPSFNHRTEVTGPAANRFGDPFSDTRDPLLHDITWATPPPVRPGSPGGDNGSHGLVGDDSTGGINAKLLNPPTARISSPRNTGIKRRKSQAKKVVCVPAPSPATSRPASGEVVPSDLWAWRKYGQKPIKGSPYPRGYYRCSSSKGCSARKQVERSRTDPNMLVITYTSEHNHPWPTQRNALAGSTRSQLYKNNAASKALSSKPPDSKEEDQFEDMSDPAAGKEEGSADKTVETLAEEPEFMNMDGAVNEPSYRPASPIQTDKDFFDELGEFETDPLHLLMTGGFVDSQVEKENNCIDPFSFFDWTCNYTSSRGDGDDGQ